MISRCSKSNSNFFLNFCLASSICTHVDINGATSDSQNDQPNVEIIQQLRDRIQQLEKRNAWLEERSTNAAISKREAVFEGNDGIFASLQLAHYPFHRNFKHLSTSPSAFWIEVGANSRDLIADVMSQPNGAFSRGAFLLTFEPLLDKYAALLTRFGGGIADKMQALGLHHEQSIALPLAVGCQGSAKFHVAQTDGCSSLLRPKEDHVIASDPLSKRWEPWVWKTCGRSTEERHVPCVSLEHIIDSWLDGRKVEYLKVDAQGFDLDVVRSAGRFVGHLQVVSLEVQCDFVSSLYAGAPNCTSVFLGMLQLGFVTSLDRRICKLCRELDIVFARPGAWVPPHLTKEPVSGTLFRAGPLFKIL